MIIPNFYTFTVCNDNDQVGISTINFTPDNPIPGSSVKINVKAQPKIKISEGITMKAIVKTLGIKVGEISYDICNDLNVNCPIESGKMFETEITFDIPIYAPSNTKV